MKSILKNIVYEIKLKEEDIYRSITNHQTIYKNFIKTSTDVTRYRDAVRTLQNFITNHKKKGLILSEFKEEINLQIRTANDLKSLIEAAASDHESFIQFSQVEEILAKCKNYSPMEPKTYQEFKYFVESLFARSACLSTSYEELNSKLKKFESILKIDNITKISKNIGKIEDLK